MIAYNRQWLDARNVRDAAANWHTKHLISPAIWQAIHARYPVGFYSPNVFIRIGLGIFCWILVSSVGGLAALFASMISLDSLPLIGMLLLFSGACIVAMLEFFVRSRHHHGSGIDDVLLYIGAAQLIGGVCLVFSSFNGPLPYFCLALPILIAGAVRYADTLLTALAYACALAIAFLIFNEIDFLMPQVLPFAGILFSGTGYWLARRKKQDTGWRFWSANLRVVEAMSLVVFYLSGNFWVLQQVGSEFFGVYSVSFAWFFWVFTFAVPVLYVYAGLRHRDRLVLWIGLGAAGMAVFTFWYYFRVLPLAGAATLGGALLLALAYFCIRHLKKAGLPFTYTDDEPGGPLLPEAESLLVAQAFGSQTAVPGEGLSFGGGKFGGGGAGGSY